MGVAFVCVSVSALICASRRSRHRKTNKKAFHFQIMIAHRAGPFSPPSTTFVATSLLPRCSRKHEMCKLNGLNKNLAKTILYVLSVSHRINMIQSLFFLFQTDAFEVNNRNTISKSTSYISAVNCEVFFKFTDANSRAVENRQMQKVFVAVFTFDAFL